ncbi:MAG: M3 family peptidase [Gammaproteobacteria bacterium]|nr:MAG: M3 family peptidase [Gammaproteobacteria bacterium]
MDTPLREPAPPADNPLLELDGLPPFDRIEPRHVEPAVDWMLAANRAAIARIRAMDPATAEWENAILPLEDLSERLQRLWSPVSHLHGVLDSEALREAYNACLPKLTDYSTELGQDRRLYEVYRQVQEREAGTLPQAARALLEHALRDFRLAGVALEGAARERYGEIRRELSRLQTRFEEQLLDATNAWSRHIDDESALAGLPPTILGLARQNAERRGLAGWVLTLDLPCYMPVMAYAEDRELRREMYEAFSTRASDRGPHAGRWDNTPVMERILELRQELAALLGFSSYAEYSLANKMARDPEQVLGFLRELARHSKPVAERELEELRRYARETHGVQELEAWDITYYADKLRQERYRINPEMLRPYFPVPAVLEGLFAVTGRLFGITVREREGVSVWHPDVRFYELYDETGELRGQVYVDLYARPHKRGGAWMDECRVRRNFGGRFQLPVAYVTCNFTPPVGADPALITHNEVITLFHEFGHALHHLLTKVDYPSVAGINGVPWDAVELPSQFLENWCWESEALELFARHYQSGEPVDPDLIARLRAARNFQSGLQMVRQLEFALFDFRLHHEYRPGKTDIQALLDEVREEVSVVPVPEWNRFQHSFAHIFAGGYAAGYYSYKWAELLSADAYSRFEEQGVFDEATGRDFLHAILEQGGSRDPMDLFVRFRGREPRIEPLLRHAGIIGEQR